MAQTKPKTEKEKKETTTEIIKKLDK